MMKCKMNMLWYTHAFPFFTSETHLIPQEHRHHRHMYHLSKLARFLHFILHWIMYLYRPPWHPLRVSPRISEKDGLSCRFIVAS